MKEDNLWLQKDAPGIILHFLKSCTDSPEIFSDNAENWDKKAPIVTVISDGTPTAQTGWTSEQVRITVHSLKVEHARKLMTIIDGLLRAPALLHRHKTTIHTASGIIATYDPKLRAGISSAVYDVTTTKSIENFSI